MKTAAQRIAHYEARMQSTLIDPVLAVVNTAAIANYTAFVTDFYPNQVALRAILAEEAVAIIDYAAYEAYHAELYHLTKAFSGPSLQAMWVNLMAKWEDAAHLGASVHSILNRIGVDIYHLDTVVTP